MLSNSHIFLALSLSLSTFSEAFMFPRFFDSSNLSMEKRDILDFAENIIYTDETQTEFFVSIEVGGDVSASILLDIESSDLWIEGDLPSSHYQGVVANSGPGPSWNGGPATQGSFVKGSMSVANVSLTDQHFFYASSDPQGYPSSIARASTHGILGLGSSSNSTVVNRTGTSLSPVDAAMINSGHHYFTLLIAPLEDEKGAFPGFAGFFTVGSIVDANSIFGSSQDTAGFPDLSQVVNQPKVSLNNDGTFTIDDIQVNGKSAGLHSYTSGVPSGKAVTKLSTTNPYIVFDKSVVDAIYSAVPGGYYSSDDRLYHVPCTTEIYVTIIIGGSPYLIGSTDVVGTVAGSSTCVGMFQASDGGHYGYDVVLGSTFLHNAYLYYGYAGWDSKSLSQPYIQLFPLTTLHDAHQAFVQYRYNGTETAAGHGVAANSVSQSQGYANPSYSGSYWGATSQATQWNYDQTSSPPNSPTASPQPVKTRLTTVTVTHTPTTTVMIGTPYASAYGGGSSSYSGNGNSQQGTDKNLEVAGNLDTSSNSDSDKNLPTGSIADQLKHCLPAIIVGAIVVGLFLIGIVIYCLVSGRRKNRTQPSAYKSLHQAESGASHAHVPLYGAEEERGATSYSDPYRDEK